MSHPKNRVCKKLCVWNDFFAEKIIPYTQFFTNSKNLEPALLEIIGEGFAFMVDGGLTATI